MTELHTCSKIYSLSTITLNGLVYAELNKTIEVAMYFGMHEPAPGKCYVRPCKRKSDILKLSLDAKI